MSGVTTYRNLLVEFRTTVDNAEKQGVYVSQGTKNSHIQLAKECQEWSPSFGWATILLGISTGGFGIESLHQAYKRNAVSFAVNSLITALLAALAHDCFHYSESYSNSACAVRRFYSALLGFKPIENTQPMFKVVGETLEKLEPLAIDPSISLVLDSREAEGINKYLSEVERHCGSTYLLPNFLNRKI